MIVNAESRFGLTGAIVSRDLEQLWRRIIFSICVSNTDDHLRNHGFLLTQNGWILSPAFDINPNPDSEGIKLNISESDNSQDLELALTVVPYFRLQASRAKKILGEVVGSASNWKKVASKLKIPKSEIHRMERAFRIADQ